MKNLKKKKGFTLIELMIVLAIIAILAVVLIPKAGIFKSQAKNAGVITNVNTVRAYLETKTGDSAILSADDLKSALNAAFGTAATVDERIKNPFSTDNNTNSNIELSSNVGSDKVSKPAIIIAASTPTISKDDYAGAVVVEIESNQYEVYGVNNDGTQTQIFTINK